MRMIDTLVVLLYFIEHLKDDLLLNLTSMLELMLLIFFSSSRDLQVHVRFGASDLSCSQSI